jgi:hypothetical protein
MSPIDYLLGSVIGLLGVGCLVHLWWRPESKHVAVKLGWSLLVLLPLVGPLLYGALYEGRLEPRAGVDRPTDGAFESNTSIDL